MPNFSVLTNSQAASAVLNLVKTLGEQNSVQTRMNTGLRIATAKDDASGWAIATTMRSDIAGFQAVRESLNFTNSTVAAGRASSEKVADLINDIQTKVTDAQLQGADVSKIQADIDGLVETIKTTVNSAGVNGVNVINNSGIQQVLASVDRSASGLSAAYINIQKSDLRVEGGSLGSLANINLQDRGDALLGAADATDGVRKVALAEGSIATALTINYTDNDGAQSLDVVVNGTDAASIVNDLNADASFADRFAASDDGQGNVLISAKDRVNDQQITFTGFADQDAAAITPTYSGAEMTFEDEQPMEIGESLVVEYEIGGTAQTLTMVVTEGQTSGDVLGTDENGNLTVALNADIVSISSATGAQIAAEVELAMQSDTNFETGVAGANLGAMQANVTADGQIGASDSAGTGSFFLATNSNADSVTMFRTPLNDFSAVLAELDTARETAISSAATLGSAQMQLENQDEFLGELVNALNEGLGTLVDANMAEEAARFQALQVQQQLGVQALSIANQQPQIILSLFG